tara:strand:- start:6 stop:461 length:456 start_codon:yes stop_codon:yes gene_type:complete
MAGFKKDDDENTYLAGEFHNKMMNSKPSERMKYFNKFAEKIKERKKNKKDKKNPDASLKEGSVYREGGQVPLSDARTRGKKYHMGGSVGQMNPTESTNRMNPNQSAIGNNAGNNDSLAGGWHGQSQWWGGTKPKNEPRQEMVYKKGGKVKK